MSSALVLVVVVNNRHDWQRVVDERWYRVPLKHAPQSVAVDYLAFYLTKPFGVDAWHVPFFAPVHRYHLQRRVELLPDEPDHPRADELYYRIEFGAVQRLERPVPSRRLRRVVFIPTTWERLCLAEDVAELWMTNDTSDLVWTHFPDAAHKATSRLQIEERRLETMHYA